MPTNSASQERATRATKRLGDDGESLARTYLEQRGFVVVDANWRCREGEIDLVAFDGTQLVIVEVKTRRSARYGSPIEAVTTEKLHRLRRLAAAWSREHEVRCSGVRVDVIGLMWNGDTVRIDHRRGVEP